LQIYLLPLVSTKRSQQGYFKYNIIVRATKTHRPKTAYFSHIIPTHIFPYFCFMMNVKDDLQQRWWDLEATLVERFGKKPDMEAILFLIGIQETDFFKQKITKEQKQDLMHVAICTILSNSGYYAFNGTDADGWPHFKQLREIPVMSLIEQENFLKDHVLLYFNLQGI